MIYLDEEQVKAIVKEAEAEGNTVSIRCIRKTKGNEDMGTEKGKLHTLICTTKPEYKSKGDVAARKEQDQNNHVLTVWAVNRKTGGKQGAWRRVNLAAVQEVRYKEHEYKVIHS